MNRLIAYVGFAFLSLVRTDFALAEGMAKNENGRLDYFASNGMYTTLKECVLPTTCGGEPFFKQKQVKRQTSNDHDVDQRTVYFDGLTIELWYVLAYPYPSKKVKDPYKRPEILSVEVTSPRWRVAHGLRVGVKRSMVLKKLGIGQVQGSCMEYVNEHKQDSVTFCFQDDRVKNIKWVPWNDA